jgi:hypothetical protein
MFAHCFHEAASLILDHDQIHLHIDIRAFGLVTAHARGGPAMRRCLVPLVFAGLLGASVARANDTSSELALGGLRFVRTDTIAIEREDLFLSPAEVRVRYAMRNLTDRPVTLHVAFPLPPVPVETPAGFLLFDEQGHEAGRSLHAFDLIGRSNFLDFRVWMNGRPILPETEIRALLPDGRDVTAALREIGGTDLLLRPRWFTDAPVAGEEGGDVGPNILRQLEALGAVAPGAAQEGAGQALWRAQVTFHWDATFQPGVTVVEHRYRPITGFRFQGFAADADTAHARQEAIDAYCIPPEEVARLDGVLAAKKDPMGSLYFDAVTLGYVLSTGGNWAGPIGHFHLEISSAGEQRGVASADTIALCAEFPLHRLPHGRTEADIENFSPTREIQVLLLRTGGTPIDPP